MKTTEQKLQHVMEAAGECCHEWKIELGMWICTKCGVQHFLTVCPDHLRDKSPDDLNELFRLAEKLGYKYHVKFGRYGIDTTCTITKYMASVEVSKYGIGNSKAEALLNALFIATGGVE